MDIGCVTVAGEVDDIAFVMVLPETAERTCGHKACPGCWRFLPVEANVAHTCKTRVFKTVIAENDVEFVLNFLGGGITVPGGKDFYLR